MGHEYSGCPSIKNCLDRDEVGTYDIKKVEEYLVTGFPLEVTSRMSFPCVMSGEVFSGELCYRTDGEWLWQDDLAYYLTRYSVALPPRFLDQMKHNEYAPPAVSDEQIVALDWPVLCFRNE